MASLLFGTAGIPESTWPKETGEGIRRVAALGLDCMEVEFVQGVYLDEAHAKAIAGITAWAGEPSTAYMRFRPPGFFF